MGEAKRRKQALGKAYGEIPPVLVPGSRQFELHMDKFTLAWEQLLAEVEQSVEKSDQPDQERLQTQQEQIINWLADYLKPYREPIRQQLLGEVLDIHYGELYSVEREKDPEVMSQGIVGWVMEALMLYKVFKPQLSPTQRQIYEEPLREFYDIMQEEEKEMDKEEEEFKQKMSQLFQACLDDEDQEYLVQALTNIPS